MKSKAGGLALEEMTMQEIKCVNCAHFKPLAPHEDAVALPDELNRGLCVRSEDGRPAFFGDMTCDHATPAYREHARA